MTAATVRRACVAAAGVAAVALITLPIAAQTLGEPERFTALAVNMNGVRTGTAQIEIAVTRWSTDAERDRLINTLLDKGQNKLLDVLQDMPRVGFIRQTTSIGWDLHYARHTPLPDGGERVVVATDRPVSGFETFNQTRTLDYPFTIVQLTVNSNGEGEGKMSYATKLTADKETKTVTVENWGEQPILLQAVKREKPSH